jgi:protease YdgD
MVFSCAAFGFACALAASAAAASVWTPKIKPSMQVLVTPIAVFGTDDRVPLPTSRQALGQSVGLLYEAASHTICSAFCVGDATIATAGHCIFRTQGEPSLKTSGFTFRLPSARTATSSRIAGVQQGTGAQFVAASSSRLSVYPPIDAAHDWALIRLEAPICARRALPVSRRPAEELVKLSAQDRVYQVGYHRDFGNWQLALGTPCAIRRGFAAADWKTISRDFTDAEHVILHTCDTGGASSGSPLLIDGPAGPEVIGINVGTYVQSRVLTQNGEVVHRYKADSVANTGVSAEAFMPQLLAFTRADILPTRAKLRELQILLAAEGHYAGQHDGTYGPELRAGIERFERAEGRPETGLATRGLLARLKALSMERVGATATSHRAQIETGRVGSHETSKATSEVAPR